jgi:hypothetical protein
LVCSSLQPPVVRKNMPFRPPLSCSTITVSRARLSHANTQNSQAASAPHPFNRSKSLPNKNRSVASLAVATFALPMAAFARRSTGTTASTICELPTPSSSTRTACGSTTRKCPHGLATSWRLRLTLSRITGLTIQNHQRLKKNCCRLSRKPPTKTLFPERVLMNITEREELCPRSGGTLGAIRPNEGIGESSGARAFVTASTMDDGFPAGAHTPQRHNAADGIQGISLRGK